MKHRSACLIALGALTGLPLAAEAASLDGSWNTTVQCPREPGGGEAYVWRFTSAARNGHLHGQYRSPGAIPSATIDGQIGPDGSGTLHVTGRAGDPRYNLSNVAGGTPIDHQVAVRFSGASGTGERMSGRTCHYTFSRR